MAGHKWRKATLPLGMLLALAACDAPPTSNGPTGQAVQIGQAGQGKSGALLFAQNCAACHGAGARGDGPAAAGLLESPADLTLIAERSGGVFPADDVLAKVHGYGGPGHFGDMPDFADLEAGATVIWETQEGQRLETPRALVALVGYLDGLQC